MPRSKATTGTASGERKPDLGFVVARQIAYYDPLRPDMDPVFIGRPYNQGPEDDEKIRVALARFTELFAADPHCRCVLGVFDAVYATAATMRRLRR